MCIFKSIYSVFHVIEHQENCSYEHAFFLMGFRKASMEPQDQAQKLLLGQKYNLFFFSGSGR